MSFWLQALLRLRFSVSRRTATASGMRNRKQSRQTTARLINVKRCRPGLQRQRGQKIFFLTGAK